MKLDRTRSTLLGVACLVILACTLTAGLWPFHAPRNQAQWLLGGGGLAFGKHGIALSASPFKPEGAQWSGACAVEVWIDPWVTAERSTILAFYAPNHTIPLELRQSDMDLLIQSGGRGINARGAHAKKLFVNGVFRANRPVVIAVTSNGRQTVVYINGKQAADSASLVFSRGSLTGEVVLANSPVKSNGWIGVMKGLAVYDEFLRPLAARSDFEWWTGSDTADAARAHAAALYVFDQTSGARIPNRAGAEPALIVPAHFKLIHQVFLERPWDEYSPSWEYVKDILINIFGLVPLGFFFYTFAFLVWPRRRAALITICLGAAVSVTIEISQSFLPTRDSGMTDLMTNTLGTALGVLIASYAVTLLASMARSRGPFSRRLATWLIGDVPPHPGSFDSGTR